MTTHQVNSWDDELAKYAGAYNETEVNAVQEGAFISTRGGRLSYKGKVIPGDKLNMIIVDYTLENHLYEGRFDAQNLASPVCYAFGMDEESMAPHPACSKPQSDRCKGCPKNEFGTAEVGAGKACKNIRRIGMLPVVSVDEIPTAEFAFLKIPVTSVKNFSNYVKQLANALRRPPFGVVTEISILPDSRSQFVLQFKLVDKIEDVEMLKAIIARKDGLNLEQAYPAPKAEAAAPAKKEKF